MPKQIEDKLKKSAVERIRQGSMKKKKGETDEQSKNRYVYGAMKHIKGKK